MTSVKLLLLLLCIIRSSRGGDDCQHGMIYPGESANGYMQCVNGQLMSKNCLGDNTYFDANFLVCRHGNPPSSGGASSPPGGSVDNSGNCARLGMVGDLTDCRRFYHCDAKGGRLQLSQCPEGLIFDLTGLSCVRGTCG